MMNGSSGCSACRPITWVALVVYALVTLIALYGAYNTHFLPTGFTAGTPEGSLAVLALLFSVHLTVKTFKRACPCGCGAGCNCGPTK